MARPKPGYFGQLLENLGYTSALARRLQNLIAQYESPPATCRGKRNGRRRCRCHAGRRRARMAQARLQARLAEGPGREASRPRARDLPVNLSIILADLERIDASAEKVGAELAIASFKWLVADGMVLDPVRHRLILEYLNFGYAPFRYRDLERLATFQNRVLREVRRGAQDRLPRRRADDAVRSRPVHRCDPWHAGGRAAARLDRAAAPGANHRPASGRRHLAKEDFPPPCRRPRPTRRAWSPSTAGRKPVIGGNCSLAAVILGCPPSLGGH